MAGDTLFRELSESKQKYSEKSVRRSIIIIRISSNKPLVRKHRKEVFKYCSKIIVKNTNNFFNLVKGVERGQMIHEHDDIISECYIILNKCIEKFNLKEKKWKFYFYFNKSASQGLFRLKERNYGIRTNKFSHINAEDVVQYEKTTFTHINNYPLFLEKNFNSKEILLMHSKLAEEKIDDFCKKTEMSKNEYYRVLKKIKEKIGKKYL